MAKAMDQSCAIYRGKNALEAWLAYSAELFDMSQFKADLELTKVIEKYYPESPDVVANVGALYSVLHRDKEALPYLERSVQLAPNDSINVWNLALEYEDLDEIAKAEILFPKALSLVEDPKRKQEMNCRYAHFLETKLKDRPRACTLQKSNCAAEKQTACVPGTPAPVAAH
jgi:tetratricopeptide (TPR) repeat protein